MTISLEGVYHTDVLRKMRNFYDSLSEKDRRRYAAAEAIKFGYGGVAYIAKLFECSRESVDRGMEELDQLPNDPVAGRIRRQGAGRKRTEEKQPEVIQQVKDIIKDRTAGDPMRENVTWTDLSPVEIANQMELDFDVPITPPIVRRVLGLLNFRLRKIAKILPGKEVPDRDQQFLRIAELKEEFLGLGLPVISMDTKKKEFLGGLYRAGRVYTTEAIKAFDHDFPTWANGVIIPHGFYDLARNAGCLHLGLSRDTSEFACDSLRLYLEREIAHRYPNAGKLLLLCDGGGSNGSRTHIFKQGLQHLVNELGMTIRVAHYPAYCSKYNPIERRFFSHVTRACQGVLFDTLATVRSLMEKTNTKTGLKATVRVIEKIYETGRKASEAFKAKMPIKFDDILPKWNYQLVPQSGSAKIPV